MQLLKRKEHLALQREGEGGGGRGGEGVCGRDREALVLKSNKRRLLVFLPNIQR